MSRATHDFECLNCGAMGKVSDDVIMCPECGKSIEGQAITGEALANLLVKISQKRIRIEEVSPASKENRP